MKRNNIIIVLLIISVILLGVGLLVTAQQPAKKTVVVMNNTTLNNTTGVNTTVDKISNDDNLQPQNTVNDKQDTLRESESYKASVQDAQRSREKGGQCADMSDEQIEEMVYNDMMYGRV